MFIIESTVPSVLVVNGIEIPYGGTRVDRELDTATQQSLNYAAESARKIGFTLTYRGSSNFLDC